jgi:hypothetical protein
MELDREISKDVLPHQVPVVISRSMEEPERVERMKKQWEHLAYVRAEQAGKDEREKD